MRFSVLIPVYNVEKYLKQCLESVLTQDFEDFEIVLVNDGSTDNSAKICEEYASADKRVVYFDKENEGLLLTRRFAIKRARGEYCLFLDSDDYWETNVLSRLDSIINKTNVDLITYRFHRIRDNGKLIYDDVDIFENEMLFTESNKEQFLKKFVSSSRLNLMWIKCVKRSIIDIDADYSRFKDLKGEDLLQSIAILKNAKTIYYINDPLVFYRLSPTGRGRNFKIKYISDYEVVRSYIYDNLLEMKVSKDILNAFFVRYIQGLMDYLNYSADICNREEFFDLMNEIKKFKTYKEAELQIGIGDVNKEASTKYRLLRDNNFVKLYNLSKNNGIVKKMLKIIMSKSWC